MAQVGLICEKNGGQKSRWTDPLNPGCLQPQLRISQMPTTILFQEWFATTIKQQPIEMGLHLHRISLPVLVSFFY